MNPLVAWLTRPFTRTGVAKAHLEQSRKERPAVQELGRDIERLHNENHITAKVHNAIRGAKDKP